MRKMIISSLLASTLLLTACESAESEETEATDNTETAQGSEVTDQDETTDSTVDASDETDDTDEDAEPAEPAEYVYEVSDNYAYVNVIEGKEATNDQVALLTFDDGPNEHTLKIAKTLAEKDAPAIFFVNSMYLLEDEGKEILQEIYDMGFEIGNHTHTHASLPSISEEKQTEEIIQTNDLVEEIIGTRPRFFRAPFGQNTDHSKQVVIDEGMALMNWTFGYDWEDAYRDPDALADIMINTDLLVSGSNLLMHDRDWTAEALPEIIDGLRAKDYAFIDPDLILSTTLESEADSE